MNQGQCGSCCTFSAVAAIESITLIQAHRELNLSEQEIVSCDNQNNAAGCLGSSLPGTYKFILRNGGLSNETDIPYTGTNGTCMLAKETPPAAKNQLCAMEASISSSDTEIRRRPYHRNCSCALHRSRENSRNGMSSCCNTVSYPKRMQLEGAKVSVSVSSSSSSFSSFGGS
ncbi:uncharacterized protein A4U43_C08F8070 [Asparagus officinalis]|nr:uncharacterized protein A4U43_C08F8070 [Asparagus officinalis]